jgi:exopolysaccharide biosynthesis polyprenyl glycosylphosphotransferase
MQDRPITTMSSSLEAAPRPLPALEPKSLPELLGVRPRRASGPRNPRAAYLRRILVAADVVAVFCALVTVTMAVGIQANEPRTITRDALLLLVAIPCWILVARLQGHYQESSHRANHDAAEDLAAVLLTTTLWAWFVLMLASIAGVQTPAISKLADFWIVTLCYLMLFRCAARAWSRRRGWYRQNAIVVGAPDEAAAIVPKLLRHPEYGIEVIASVELASADHGPPSRSNRIDDVQVPVIRGDLDLLELTAELAVDRVIFGPSLHHLPDYHEVLSELKQLQVHVDVVPVWCDVVDSRARLHELEGMTMIGVPSTRLTRPALLAKRALDMTISALALLLLLPLLAVCAIAVKLDSPGPILFRQRRVGRNDRRFDLLKFRSMRADAEQLKHNVSHLNVHGGGTENGMFKIHDDPRITRVGRILRRHSLDELPQLVNVLLGDMSLVGPRPLIESEDRQIEGRHRRRIKLTPGLTGLWQVNGRSDIPFEGMIDLDYLYVTNWSMWGDIKLLLKTFGAVTRGRGAY